MKKLLSILVVCITTLLIFSACSEKKIYPITVDSAKLDSEIYSYFMQDFMSSNKDVTDLEIIKNLTEDRCAEYVAVNTLFKISKERLSEKEKSEISENVKNQWFLYNKYYTEIGISKQTITKVQKYLSYRDHLLNYYYGTNGLYPVADSKIKDYFTENYVAFKAINGYLTTVDASGQTVKLSDEEIEKIKAEFLKMASDLNTTGGPNIDDINKEYMSKQGNEVTGNLETLILEKSSTSYPAGFFDNVAKMEYGTAYVRIIENYIFLIQRIDLSTSDELFSTYKQTCLNGLMKKDFEDIIKSEMELYSVKTDSKLAEKCYNKVLERENKTEK